MLQVKDLRVEVELLPLFNHTHTYEAEQALLGLLQKLPPTLAEVLERQAVLRAMLAQWSILADFSYSRLQLQEAREFLQQAVSGRLPLETNQVKMAGKLLLSEEARYQSRARYVQCLLLLRRLEQQYFNRLDAAQFPAGFKPYLLRIAHFLERFSLADTAQVIAEDAFSARHMVRFARQLLGVKPEELTAFWEAFYLVEAYWSAAKGLLTLGLVFPEFQETGLELVGFYHPLVKAPVKNTLHLNSTTNVLVLTGPNMSGKSTLLRAVSLCVYLAQAGLGVPAAVCRLPFFTSVAVALNLSDNLAGGYSHFMAEINNLKAVVQAAQAGGWVFAVFDELFRGTNADDALEITATTLQGLAAYPESYSLVSTHLLELESQLPARVLGGAYCIECVLQEGVPVFSYRLQKGWSTLRIGRIMFEQAGLHRLLRPHSLRPLEVGGHSA
ncbi:hypothetical protein [Hymenobacter sp. UYP22]|uniref:MutS-related protein n=1 Tax=Hymenobacter sp. UYP22 TaxID=3156348 RepID=UPI0033965DB1